VSDNHLTKYISYLKYEKNLTDNSVDAYLRDLQKLSRWASDRASTVEALKPLDLEAFLASLHEVGITPSSQRRILSGLKSYYRFLQLEHVITDDPSELIEAPKIGQHLPTVLTLEEVNRVIARPDVSTPLGQRNRAILETLYSCGVRVSELISLRISNIYEEEGYIRVDGKGRKQRIVPIAQSALREIHNYFQFRYEMDVKPGSEDIVFLNRFGGKMTRMAVFNIIKQYCAEAGIRKEVSPHTFRHTFATHLLEGGANLRAIQMMLGHEQISTTEIYSQVDRQFLKEEILTYHPRNKV
jgi:integrase/recombinase XerD